jgi:hypothetical protein
MTIIRPALILFIGAALGGCAAAPKTAPEFRQSVSAGAMGHAYESFVVDRSSRAIGETFKAQADKCINVQVNRTTTVNINHGARTQSNTQFIYKPMVLRKGDRTEMHIQMQVTGNVVKMQSGPEAGYYVLVADAIPVSKNSAKVDIYYSTYRAKSLSEAVKGWAHGNNLGCPDIAGTLK